MDNYKMFGCIVGALYSSVSYAQMEVEEILITGSQDKSKKESFPSSIGIDADVVNALGIDELSNLSHLISGFIVQDGSRTTNINIRGMGSTASIGSESSVGYYIDGVNYGLNSQLRLPLMDIEQVSVLKGPQVSSYGQSSSIGVVDIKTSSPDRFFESHLILDYEPKYNAHDLEFVASGPLTETLKARIAIKGSQSDGYINNGLTNDDEPGTDSKAVRGTLVWDAAKNLVLTTKIEHSQLDELGAPFQLSNAGDYEALYQSTIPEFGVADFTKYAQTDSYVAKFNSFTSLLAWDLGDVALTNKLSWSNYKGDRVQDVDFGPLELLGREQYQEATQFSEDLVLDINLTEQLTVKTGFYYHRENVSDRSSVHRNLSPILTSEDIGRVSGIGALGVIESSCGPLPDGVTPESLAANGTSSLPSSYLFCLFANSSAIEQGSNQAVAGFTTPITVATDFAQLNELYSVYSDVAYDITGQLQANLSFRYSIEEKSASRATVINDYNSDLPLGSANPNIDANDVLKLNSQIFGLQEHNISTYGEPNYTAGQFKLEYHTLRDDVIYASVSSSFKPGGSNATGQRDDVDNFSFSEERVTSYELGINTDVMKGQLTLGAAGFYNRYRDLQIGAFQAGSFEVDNADEAITRGVDISANWKPSDDLNISLSSSYLDAYYKDYKNASCNSVQLEQTQVGQSCFQDLSGRGLAFAPRWNVVLGVDYRRPMGDNLEFLSYAGVNYNDDIYVSQNLDPQSLQGSYSTVDLRLGIASSNGDWELAVLGKNISDEKVVGFQSSVPGLSSSSFVYLLPPRTVALQLRLFF